MKTIQILRVAPVFLTFSKIRNLKGASFSDLQQNSLNDDIH